ncbi:MAG TPA: hypothetical protein VLD36_06590 [Burkholderiales bacterium]|nr:hypothetical protein [Burkholderiales bacterium]
MIPGEIELNAGRRTVPLVALAGALLVAGCATTQVAVQWSDPEFRGRSLRGEKVLVVCDAADVATRRVCQDQLAGQVGAAGATPVISPDVGLTAGPPPANDKTLAAARALGAKAILGATIEPDVTVVSPGPSIGIGVGGYGGSGGRSVTGGGVGIGFPIGGGQATTGYAANMVLTDVASVRMMWSSKVTTPASQNVSAQMGELARVGIEAARTAGFF